MNQIFNALNGAELKKAVLADIEREMDLSGEFRNHVTYPWVKYTAHLTLLSYPKQAMDAEPGLKLSVSGVATDNPDYKFMEEPEVVLDLKSVSVIDVPDQTRVDSGQPIPTQAIAAGVLIDKGVHRPKVPVTLKTAQVKPVLQTPASAPKPATGSPVGVPGIDPSA